MARIDVFGVDSAEWVTGKDSMSEAQKAEMADDREIEGAAKRVRHPGSQTAPQLFECRVGPNQVVDAHAHTLDEIIYVVSGSMQLGGRTLEPGASVHIPGRTLYSFSSGADGLHFLNFRGTADSTYFTKQQFMAMRATAET
jgi:mannose-6-phosphate isomerase-like protein (cupin superfamily)